MPSMPPTAVKRTDHKDRRLSPHNIGIEPPTVEPIAMKIQISDFEFIPQLIVSYAGILINNKVVF